MNNWNLAQLNIAHLCAPIESAQLADFVANLDEINRLAEQSPGFVWRLELDVRNSAVPDKLFGQDMIVNMSTWESIQSLHDYVYHSAHTKIMARRKEWFQRMNTAYAVLWWVPDGHRPTLLEASNRLKQLRENGPEQSAFTFKNNFSAPDS